MEVLVTGTFVLPGIMIHLILYYGVCKVWSRIIAANRKDIAVLLQNI